MPFVARRLFTIDPAHPLADMPVAQLKLCALLLSHESPTMSQVAEELRISVSAVTQLADRLERTGLVERVTAAEVPGCPDRDRRARHLRLTARGRELMISRRELRQDGARAALALLTPEQRQTVLAALELLAGASRQIAAPGAALADADTPENMAHLEWSVAPAGAAVAGD